MTMADAIHRARAGEAEGFEALFQYTAPGVWMSAVVLGCPDTGSVMTQIYRDAQQAIASLRSPSDIRVWIGRITYHVLLQKAEVAGGDLPHLTGDAVQAYPVIASLPRRERAALLLMCGDGCSAAQAGEILSESDIEIKRALRRARQTIAAHMKEQGCTETCNTVWLIQLLASMREQQADTIAPFLHQVLHCVQTGEPFADAQQDVRPMTQKETEKGTFFSKLFRSKRFGSST